MNASRSERPNFIISADQITETPGQYPGRDEIFSFGRPIGEVAGLRRLGVHIERLPPGHRTSLPHAEETDEEFVFVLRGEVDAWVDGHLYKMREFDFAAFPAGTGVAHTFVNNWKDDVYLLVGGEKSFAQSRVYYPLNPERSNELGPLRWWDGTLRSK